MKSIRLKLHEQDLKTQFKGHKSFQGQRSRSQGHEICFLHIYQSCLTFMPSIRSIRLKLKEKLHEQDLKIQFPGQKSFQGQRSRSQGHEICFLHIYQSCFTFMPSITSNGLKPREKLHEQDLKAQFQGHKSFQGQRSRSQGHEICFLHIYQSCLTCMPSIRSIGLKLKEKLHEQDLKTQFEGHKSFQGQRSRSQGHEIGFLHIYQSCLTFMPSIKSIKLKLKEKLHEQEFRLRTDRPTDRPNDRPTDRPTGWFQYTPFKLCLRGYKHSTLNNFVV